MNHQAALPSTMGHWDGVPGLGHVEMPPEVTEPLKFAGALMLKDHNMRFWCASYKVSPFVQRVTLTHALLDTGNKMQPARTLHNRFTVAGVPFTIFPIDTASAVQEEQKPSPE